MARPMIRQSADEKLADALEDAEMYLGGAIEEMESSLRDLRKAKATLRMKRMNLAKKIKAARAKAATK